MKKRMAVLLLAVNALCLALGCTDAARAKFGGLGDAHRIELYSGGELVKTWYSAGKVASEERSDGYYFMDYETKLLVEVSGDVVISRVANKDLP